MKFKSTVLEAVKREDFSTVLNIDPALHKADSPESVFAPSINQFQKLAAGLHFWFIADAATGLNRSAGGMLEQITDIPLHDFINKTPQALFEQTHPEDLPAMFAFTKYWIEYLNSIPRDQKLHLHPTIYIRLKNKDKLFRWVMVQFVETISDEKGNVLFGLTLVTDIGHVKKEGPAMMSILDMHNEQCQHFFCSDGQNIKPGNEALPGLSTRELEVLRFLATGSSSKQVANDLNIAIKTVDNHRQRMLQKTQSKSTAELVRFAIKGGYI